MAELKEFKSGMAKKKISHLCPRYSVTCVSNHFITTLLLFENKNVKCCYGVAYQIRNGNNKL
jgi:hypothetical protein